MSKTRGRWDTADSRTRIFLLERDATRRYALRRLLQFAGYSVRTCGDPARLKRRWHDCDVCIAVIRNHDPAALRLLRAVRAPRGAGRIRVAVVCDEAVAGGNGLSAVDADRVLAEPLDCGALLRWTALPQVERLRYCGDWVRVARWKDASSDARTGRRAPAYGQNGSAGGGAAPNAAPQDGSPV